MKSLNCKSLFVVAVTTALIFGSASQVKAQKSPNGFLSPQCTWWADWQAFYSGWRLQFSTATGRDAPQWWWKVTNAGHSNRPRPGGIMVTDNHVAFITEVDGDPWNIRKWRVYHSNFPVGSTPRYDWFEFAPNGRVKRVGGGATYGLLGFLFRL